MWSPAPEFHAAVPACLGTFVNGCGVVNDAPQLVSASCVIFHSCSVLKALVQEFLVP